MDSDFASVGSNYHPCDELPRDATPCVALLPAGGEVWEDFLDTIDVSLARFCEEGPGGWMLGYVQALGRIGFRTLIVFFSAQVARPTRYLNARSGDAIVVLPAPRWWARLRNRLPTYRQVLTGQVGQGRREQAAVVCGAALWHLSTPLEALARELRAQRCRALICQEYEYFRFEAASLVGRRLGLPVFATFQGSDVEENPLSRLVKPWTVGRAAGLLIAPGEEVERVRARYGRRARVYRVFNPVDTGAWRPGDRTRARAELGAGPATRIAVWHGRVAIYAKGLDLLLEAWTRVRRERPGRDLRLLLLGTGEDAAAFRSRLRDLDDGGVCWTDRYVTDRPAIRRFLAAGDVFAFPSRLEGFAVAPLEAMACGLPVVAADASGVRDIFPAGEMSGGLVVPRDEPAAFAAALARLLEDPALSAELGTRAMHRIEAAFSPDAVGLQLRAALADAGVSFTPEAT